jgi:putative ABC transport system substrate-binding protein
MKKLSKIAVALLAGLMVVGSLAGCGKQEASQGAQPQAPAGNAQEEKVFKIGVVQLLEHDALDASYKGFVDGLKEAGFEEGKNITIDYNNAQNEQANCQTIANKLVNNNADLILAIATPAAQAVANVTQDIPILVTAVTDPADAKLVKDNKAPGGNVTGTSDLTPVKEQIDLIKQIIPDVKTIGILYTSSESNSLFQVNLAKQAAANLGIEVIEGTVSSSNEIQQVAQSLVGKVEAIYVPTDNMMAAGMSTISMVMEPAKIPVIVGEEGMVANGGLATYGINYYNLGKLTAQQAVAILRDGKKPADMPIEYLTELNFSLNQEVADAIGVEIPAELLAKVK